MEKWKSVLGYEGIYEVSSFGLIRSIDRYNGGGHKKNHRTIGKIKAIIIDPSGYQTVSLYLKGRKMKMCKIHRLVAQAFIENPENKPQVNHKNGIKIDNRVENLEWCTAKENSKHAWENGLKKSSQYRYRGALDGEKCWKTKIKESSAIDILKNCLKNKKSIESYSLKYGLSKSAISHIVYRRSWKHLKIA